MFTDINAFIRSKNGQNVLLHSQKNIPYTTFFIFHFFLVSHKAKSLGLNCFYQSKSYFKKEFRCLNFNYCINYTNKLELGKKLKKITSIFPAIMFKDMSLFALKLVWGSLWMHGKKFHVLNSLFSISFWCSTISIYQNLSVPFLFGVSQG